MQLAESRMRWGLGLEMSEWSEYYSDEIKDTAEDGEMKESRRTLMGPRDTTVRHQTFTL